MNTCFGDGDVISENEDGDYSSVGKMKSRKHNSPKRNKLKLPNLKLKLKKGPHKNKLFKKFAADVTGVVSIIDTISKSKKMKFNMNQSLIMKSRDRDYSMNKEIEKSQRSDFLIEQSPPPIVRNFRYKSSSSNWDRLSKPRYVYPQ